MRAAGAAVLAALLASGAPAQEIGAPEGAQSTARVVRDFDRYDLPTGPATAQGLTAKPLEGQVIWAAYRLDDPSLATASVMSGYRERLAEQGFLPVFDCATEACGGFDFRFAAAVMPPPGMLIDVRDFAQLSLSRAEPEAHVSILVSRVLKRVYIQTVTVVPASEPVEISPAPAPETAPETAIIPIEEKALYDRLIADGHVPVAGLDFAAGGATLSPGSASALDMLARLLTRNAEVKVVIVGHSDNEGGLDANIALSQKRAEAVMRALLERGVAGSQLSARGIGYLAPLTANTTPEGRATNRRVELVLE